MSRDLTTDTENASLAGHVRPVILVKIDAASGVLRVALTDRTVALDGVDYLGAGGIARISRVDEVTDLSASGVSAEISGVDPAYISMAMGESVQGRAFIIYLGFFDDDYALIDDPTILFSGRMDTIDIRIGETASIAVRAESRLAAWSRARERRYTHQDQIARFPSDKGLEFVAQTTEREIVWGRR